MTAEADETRIVTLRYFAWVREKMGRAEETLSIPVALSTVGDLVVWLKARGPEYSLAFERASVIRVALDHQHASPTAALGGAREIAFFPPVTGG